MALLASPAPPRSLFVCPALPVLPLLQPENLNDDLTDPTPAPLLVLRLHNAAGVCATMAALCCVTLAVQLRRQHGRHLEPVRDSRARLHGARRPSLAMQPPHALALACSQRPVCIGCLQDDAFTLGLAFWPGADASAWGSEFGNVSACNPAVRSQLVSRGLGPRRLSARCRA